MGINKNLIAAAASIEWAGVEAATVRGLTPQDFSAILVAEGLTIAEMFTESDVLDMSNLDMTNQAQIADRLMSQGGPLLMTLANHAPSLLARIIAVAADEEDIETATKYIAVNFSLPLQFECLAQIAYMTFNGPEGFRRFVGNVMVLVNTVQAMTSTDNKPRLIESTHSDAGSVTH